MYNFSSAAPEGTGAGAYMINYLSDIKNESTYLFANSLSLYCKVSC